MSFVHLHTHSEYSLLEASASVKDLAKKAAELKMPALALTDNGNMFGAIEFYFACLDANIKPILGLDVYLAPHGRLVKGTDRNEVAKPNTRLALLAMNYQGYQNLCQISTIGYQEGFYYKPRIDYEVLEKYNANLICLSGGLRGEVVQAFLNEGEEKALEKIKALQKIFGDRFYLEVNRTGLSQWKEINDFLIKAAKQTGVKLVAANDVHYLTADDQMSQEVLICIGSNKTLSDETRFRLGSDQFYLKSPEQMRSLFKDMPEVCDCTLEIADRCNIKFRLKDDNGKAIYHLPSYPTKGGVSLKEEIKRLSYEGLLARFNQQKPADEYYKRLDFELEVIDRMGFNGYFLIVSDFIKWAKANEIPVGPGRGSGAGSLVAYSLNITDLDPLPYSLLFERFLNPERISMPDFDIDFCQDRRQEVIEYVTNKYGQKSVSQIITYGKLQTRAAIKDVGRVLGLSFSEVDVVSKLIPEKLGITLDEALKLEPRIQELMDSDPQIATLIDLAKRIEGLVRHAGIHAAGVVIADGDLVKLAPLYKGAEGENVVQYDMKHAEKIGLIKFDFLGLKTLTHIDRALKLIEKNRGTKIKYADIPIHDPGIYQLMSKGDTAGVFQFEGEGITDAIRKIKPNNFTDITAINALYRPGPMGMIPDYAKRKNGEAEVEYIFPQLKEILQETYGIIVYQEQVMAIASKVAGYSLGEADMLRRAMGKKIKAEMDQHRERFLAGAKKNNFDEKKSDELFELIYKFAEYGFNKSHAAAYCVVAAQTAWLKNYYPAEFYAALLSTEMGDTDKVVKYVKDAQKHNLEVKPPHINYSDFYFTVSADAIYFGLGGIKGVGESAINAIVQAREQLVDKKFTSLEEFFAKVDSRKLNKKVIECLIKAGALDGFGAHRAELMANYNKFLDHAMGVKKDQELGQTNLFEMASDEPTNRVQLDHVKAWNRATALAFEKEVLGFYLSDHPLKGFENLAQVWVTGKMADLSQIVLDKNKKRVVVSGLIIDFKEHITKKGTRMAFAKIEDLTGACELVVFPDVYAKTEMYLKQDRPVLVGGNLEADETSMKILVDSVASLEEVLKKTKKMTLNLSQLPESDYERLFSFLTEHPGQTKVEVVLDIKELGQKVSMEPENISGVALSNELLENLQIQFGRTDFVEMH